MNDDPRWGYVVLTLMILLAVLAIWGFVLFDEHVVEIVPRQ